MPRTLLLPPIHDAVQAVEELVESPPPQPPLVPPGEEAPALIPAPTDSQVRWPAI
jgi:hypothetical protein